MPCYRCGTRQVDPDRGESPWKRGVRGDRQVLICPACQTAHDWMADLDRCPSCSSVRLVRRLGEAECRDCGSVRPPVASALPGHLAALAKSGRAVAGSGGSGGGPGGRPGGGSGGGGPAGSGGPAGPGGSAGGDSPAGGGPAGGGGSAAPVAAASQGSASESAAMQELAAEVEQALARVLGRTAGSAAGS